MCGVNILKNNLLNNDAHPTGLSYPEIHITSFFSIMSVTLGSHSSFLSGGFHRVRNYYNEAGRRESLKQILNFSDILGMGIMVMLAVATNFL
jgi:hypothetical protein